MLKINGYDDFIRRKIQIYMKEDINNRVAVIGGGLGDFITLDSFMNDQERNWFNVIYHVGSTPLIYRKLFFNYRNVQRYRFFWANERRKALRDIVLNNVKDYENVRIYRCFSFLQDASEGAKYNGSTFISKQLAQISKFDLPPNYTVVCPHTTKARGKWMFRKFNQIEWQNVLTHLVKTKKTGVVLGINCYCPKHPNLVNLANKTSLLETIEIVKKSSGYIGVDSVFSVVAARAGIPARKIIVKTSEISAALAFKNAYYPFGVMLVPLISFSCLNL